MAKNSTYGSESNIDLWLGRLSHISQFGFFALTIGALYFTVIPLYKTAALEEAIARREAELVTTNEKLLTATESLKKLNAEIYLRNRDDLIQDLVYISPFCSGLMVPPAKRRNAGSLGDNLLKVDAAVCLMEHFEMSKAKVVLSSADYEYLKGVVENISNELAKEQNSLVDNIATLEDRAKKDPSILLPPDEADLELSRVFKTIGIDVSGDDEKLAVVRTKTRLASSFYETVRVKILGLRKLSWPQS
ncbi:hypothetical protein [Pseudomonas japonica]|uniref:hypothetical protein n=1 Tax=Pseudomonas japonica TaxID=256466 RepID=UPI0015E373DA|nr:hypothetical protein [Pseudomonas japonica]MBA1245574.1 hypothetical protein [Pseudomonas japonica]